MKTLILSVLVLTMASISYAQNVNIPDANFINALISAGVDTSGDGEISYDEAKAIKNLDVSYKNISDLSGINAFTNIDTLECSANQLPSLDVSYNTSLKVLRCHNNPLTSLDVSGCNTLKQLWCFASQLTSLDVSDCIALCELFCGINQLTSLNVSGCVALSELSCGENQLTNLDVSDDTVLYRLDCSNNKLTSLDVSDCSALAYLYCFGNQLTSLDVSGCKALYNLIASGNKLISLDVSNNTALNYLCLNDMPTLFKVCVWWAPSESPYFYPETNNSPNWYFAYDCSATDLNAYKDNSTINIYPNPSDDIINIEIGNLNNAIMEIYDVSGKLIFSKVIHSESEEVDISDISKGIYLVKVMQDETINVGKVVVR